MVVLPRWHCKIERGVRYSYSGLEILHGGEGGDVKLGARTSKHILVFAFDPLSLNSISLIFCITLYCSYLIHAWYHLCAHTCVEPKEIHIAPQLLFREI